MWKYNSTDELFHSDDYLMHYGVLGMKWRNHVYKTLERGANNRIRSDRKSLKQMTKDYEWMKKNHADVAKSGSKIGNSKLLVKYRLSKMNKLKNKINNTKTSIREDQQIANNMNKKAANMKNKINKKTAAKQILNQAKAKYKIANKQYTKDFNSYYNNATRFGILSDVTKKQKQRNNDNLRIAEQSAKKYNSAKSAYKKAKKKYKSIR